MVNNSNQYQQHKQSPLNSDGQQFEPISTTQSITYHLNSLNTKNDHDIKRWKPRSWLGTDTKGCRVEPVHVILLNKNLTETRQDNTIVQLEVKNHSLSNPHKKIYI
jgi:hypothetical protein